MGSNRNSEKEAFLRLTVGIWAWPGRMGKNALGERARAYQLAGRA